MYLTFQPQQLQTSTRQRKSSKIFMVRFRNGLQVYVPSFVLLCFLWANQECSCLPHNSYLWFCTVNFKQLEASTLKDMPTGLNTASTQKRTWTKGWEAKRLRHGAGQHTSAEVPISLSQPEAPPRAARGSCGSHPAHPGTHMLRDQAVLGQELTVCSFRNHQTDEWGKE